MPMATAAPTKLEKLFIGEVSGVDDPANQLPGWMVAKSARQDMVLGPDRTWDVGEAEARVRAYAEASEGPTPKYAAAYLWHNGDAADANGDGVPDRFADYKFLVADVVDGQLAVMPAAIRAAKSRLADAGIPDTDKEQVAALIESIETRTGLAKASAPADAENLLSRIRKLLGQTDGDSPGREDIDMEKTELTALLDERDEALVEKFAGIVSTAVEGLKETPAEGEATTKAKGEDEGFSEAQTAAIAKAIEDGLEAALAPYNEILEKTLDRVEGVEKSAVRRFSLDGQESGSEDAEEASKLTPTQKAIAGALTRGSVEFGD